MSVRTRTHHTKTKPGHSNGKTNTKKKKIPWREVAKKEISKFSEAGVMLRGCRYKKDITQVELSKATGIRQSHISDMEHGRRPIGKEVAKRLADFFDTDYRVFL